MATVPSNIGLGRVAGLADKGDNFVVLLLEAIESDSLLVDYDTVEDLLDPGTGNDESAATNYTRKTGLAGTVVTDDGLNLQTVSLLDQSFVGIDGAPIVKAAIAYQDGAGDANLIPLSYHDVSVDPDGSTITLVMP